MKLYTYKKDKNLKFHIEGPEKSALTKNKYVLNYRSPYNSGYEVNDNVYCDIYSKSDLKEIKKLFIFLHGFSTKEKKLTYYKNFIKEMVERGYACAFMQLPFHLSRAPENIESGENMLYYDDVDTLKFFHQGVVDVKRLIDILTPYNYRQIYIGGLSLGSMVSSLSISNDKRIKKAVLLIGGGNWEEIHWKGILRFMLKGNCADDGEITRRKCHSYYSFFPKFLKKLREADPEIIDSENLGELENVTRKMCFLCDPIAFAYRVSPENILMINARFDFYFSRKSTIGLWQAFGKPEMHWLNNFHSSKIISKPKIIDIIDEFLKR